MVLSIVIVNWNTRDLLDRCLATVLASDFADSSETIVVDNASSDGSAEMVRDKYPGVLLVESGGNIGYAKGNNLGAMEATGEFILTLNPDTELQADTLSKAVDSLRIRPSYGALAVKLVSADGDIQASVRGFPTMLGVLGDATGLGRALPGSALDAYRLTTFDYSRSQDAPQPMGTFLLFRRNALAAIGDPCRPFDESFPIFFNEVDLLFRLQAAGWRCWFESSISIKHLGGASTRQVKKSMIWESHLMLLRYLRKHALNPLNLLAFWVFAMGVILAAFVRAKGYHVGFRP